MNIEKTPCCFNFIDLIRYIFRSNQNTNINTNINQNNTEESSQNIEEIQNNVNENNNDDAIREQAALQIQSFFRNTQRNINSNNNNNNNNTISDIFINGLSITLVPLDTDFASHYGQQTGNSVFTYVNTPTLQNIAFEEFDEIRSIFSSILSSNYEPETCYQKCLMNIRRRNITLRSNNFSLSKNNYIYDHEYLKNSAEDLGRRYVDFFAKSFTFSKSGVYVHKNIAFEEATCTEEELEGEKTFSAQGVFTDVIKAASENLLVPKLSEVPTENILEFL